MLRTFSSLPKQRRAATGLLLSLSLIVPLAACSQSSDQQTASPDSSASASSSSSTSSASSASSAPSSSENATSSESAQAEVPAQDENYPQAEQLKDAKTVSTDAAEVKEVNGLVNSYEQTMSSVPSAPEGSADTTSSDSGQPRQFLDEATMDSINKVAVDNAAEEYAASAAEYAQNGWHYEGTSTVVGSPKVAEGTYQGKRARFVEVCLDSSQVKTKDSSGRELQSGGKRALNIYTLVESDGTWKIAQHDFPNNPDC